jgi:hypothetical protein
MRKTFLVMVILWLSLPAKLVLVGTAAAQGTPPSYASIYDVNGDCSIDNQDVQLVAENWGSQPPPLAVYDVNTDGRVNVLDVQLVAGRWGATCSVPPPGDGLIIDHNSVDLFSQIPDSYIVAAREMRMLFRHASVGYNISRGLDCLRNYFPGEPDPNWRPPGCDRGLDPGQIVFDPKYDRSNWVFEYHQPLPYQNPGWWAKIDLFVDRVNNLGPSEPYDVVGFKFGFVDQDPNHDISVYFFSDDPGDPYPSYQDLEQLEATHPDKLVMWWTMGLNKKAQPIAEAFNEQMRQYAAANNKILLDFADISSHHPDGTPCYDLQGSTTPALCDEYSDETLGGHLNALGRQRAAKAIWVMMAQISGWQPPTP